MDSIRNKKFIIITLRKNKYTSCTTKTYLEYDITEEIYKFVKHNKSKIKTIVIFDFEFLIKQYLEHEIEKFLQEFKPDKRSNI